VHLEEWIPGGADRQVKCSAAALAGRTPSSSRKVLQPWWRCLPLTMAGGRQGGTECSKSGSQVTGTGVPTGRW